MRDYRLRPSCLASVPVQIWGPAAISHAVLRTAHCSHSHLTPWLKCHLREIWHLSYLELGLHDVYHNHEFHPSISFIYSTSLSSYLMNRYLFTLTISQALCLALYIRSGEQTLRNSSLRGVPILMVKKNTVPLNMQINVHTSTGTPKS